MRKGMRLALIVGIVVTAASTASALWFITDMFDQPSKKPQEGTPMLLPAESVPTSGVIFPTNLPRTELAEMLPENPYAGQVSGEEGMRGKTNYDTYCAVCHGPTGMGDGSVAAAGKGIPPFPLLGVAGYTDQVLFAQIWSGNGAIMGPYYWAMSPDEIWHVVNYIKGFATR